MTVTAPILLVDDDRFFLKVAADLLIRRGHQVVAVENAERAREEVARASYEVVITDMVMPGVDGLALIAQLRARFPQQEIILVSSRSDVHAAQTAMRAKVSDYLLKPLDESELYLAVDRCLERAALRREHTRLLNENMELARFQAINRHCLELLSNPDLEWVQEQVLSDLTALCDAQSAALWVADEKSELRLKAYRGLLDPKLLPERLETEGELRPRLGEGAPWTSGSPPHMVLDVPLVAAGEVVGLGRLFDPLVGEFRPEALRTARLLGDFAALGVKNARRFLALQRLGLRDRETAAYNLSYFTDYANKEIYKARRYGRTFSLLTFSIDQLPKVRLRLGADEAMRAARGITRALSRITRDSDILAKASERDFYMLLPETDFFGAVMFLRRAMGAVVEEPEVKEVEAALPLGLVGGAATFPKDGEDFDELAQKCRRRMQERRLSLQRMLALDPLTFWDEVELLLGSARSPKLPHEMDAEPSRRGKVSDLLFEELQEEIARELVREPLARGVLYVGGPQVRADLPISSGLQRVPVDHAFRAYVLGRRGDLESHPALTPVFLEGDERMARHEFILWLSENAAYALVQRRGRGATWGFHTSDAAVVEGLVSKLQAEYDLQPF
ncbi:MAG: response regulator [Myxococcota bacterium]